MYVPIFAYTIANAASVTFHHITEGYIFVSRTNVDWLNECVCVSKFACTFWGKNICISGLHFGQLASRERAQQCNKIYFGCCDHMYFYTSLHLEHEQVSYGWQPHFAIVCRRCLFILYFQSDNDRIENGSSNDRGFVYLMLGGSRVLMSSAGRLAALKLLGERIISA